MKVTKTMLQKSTGWLLLPMSCLLLSGAGAPQTAPGFDPSFAGKVNLDKFRLIAVQHDGRFKTFDTLARSTIRRISESETLGRPIPGSDQVVKQDAAFTYLDLVKQTYSWGTR